MNLWLKMAVVILILVVIATSVSSLMTLEQSRRSTIEQKINECVLSQERIIREIVEGAIIKEETDSVLLLSEFDISNIVGTVLCDTGDFFSGIGVFTYNGVCIFNTALEQSNYIVLFDKIQDGKEDVFCVCSDEERKVIRGVSSFLVDDTELVLAFEHDISSIYESWDKELRMLNKVNFIVALTVAFVMTFLLFILLYPMSLINRGVKEITNGNYEYKIAEKGSYEFKILSKNINALSQSVLLNVEKLKNISEGRKNFIDNFAHEMKTPLTSIIGFSSLMSIRKNINKEKIAEYSEIITEEANRLKKLSGKLLELSTAEHVLLDYSQVAISDFFHEIKTIMQPMLEEKKCQLNVEFDDTVINIDKELFKSLFYNLIDNAIKASLPGATIFLNCQTSQTKSNKVILSVTDEGIGMSESDIQLAIEPFYMADKARSRKENGVGLGLTLCAEIVRQHNATMHISSQLNKGTKVCIIMNTEDSNG